MMTDEQRGQLHSPYFETEYVTEVSDAVDEFHLSLRRLRSPAPLFSPVGGLSQREAVLSQQICTSVGHRQEPE